jgi:hypothetical protein
VDGKQRKRTIKTDLTVTKQEDVSCVIPRSKQNVACSMERAQPNNLMCISPAG